MERELWMALYKLAWACDPAPYWELVKYREFEIVSEALGPNIQGNPLGLEQHLCVPFNLEIPKYGEIPRSYTSLRQALAELPSKFSPQHHAEGIVFHHPDGRRAKIKRKDFPAHTPA